MFSVVEFSENCGGGLAIVRSDWYTPRKREVFWPPYKEKTKFDKVLRKGDDSLKTDSWGLFPISRIFFETDDYDIAVKKLKQAEVTSDLQTEDEAHVSRKRVPRKRLYVSDSDDDENYSCSLLRPRRLNLIPKSILEHKKNTTPSESVVLSPPSSCDVSSAGTSANKTPVSTHIVASGEPAIENSMLLKHVVHIRHQLDQVLAWIDAQKNKTDTTIYNVENLPTELPLKTDTDIENIEAFLALSKSNSDNLCTYLSITGGKDGTSTTNNILKKLFTNELACTFNFLGSRSAKKAFGELRMRGVVIDSVRKVWPNLTEKDIENYIKTWLKHAPQRYKIEQLKKER